MIKITGYREVNYSQLIEAILASKKESGKSDVQIAADINVSTTNTVKNAFRVDEYGQKVSDKVLTNIMQSVELDGFVLSIKGGKYYYISD
jgi:hypothetical protein